MKQVIDVMEHMTVSVRETEETSEIMVDKSSETAEQVGGIEKVVKQLVEELGK